MERSGEAPVGSLRDLIELRTDAVGADQINCVRLARLVVAVAANHVDVELRDDVIEIDGRMIHEIARAPKPALFTGVPDEQHRPLRPRPERVRSGESHQRHRPRSVIVRSIPDAVVLGTGSDEAGRAAATNAIGSADELTFGVPDVIVVRTQRNVGLLQLWIAALDNGYDVLREPRAHDLIAGVDVERQRHAVETKRRQWFPRVGLLLEVLVFHGGAAKQELEEGVAAGQSGRDDVIEPFGRREVGNGNRATAAASLLRGHTSPASSAACARLLRGADGGSGKAFVGGVPAATKEESSQGWIDARRPCGAQPDDRCASDVVTPIVLVAGLRSIESIANELHAIDREALICPGILRKTDGILGEGPARAADVDGDRRMAR